MKRDLDLVRKILLHCEEAPHGCVPYPLQFDGYSEEQIRFHVYLMIQAGLLDGVMPRSRGTASPEGFARAITWAGYEFLEASRNEETWSRAKNVARSAGSMTLDVLKSVLANLAAAAAQKAMGLP